MLINNFTFQNLQISSNTSRIDENLRDDLSSPLQERNKNNLNNYLTPPDIKTKGKENRSPNLDRLRSLSKKMFGTLAEKSSGPLPLDLKENEEPSLDHEEFFTHQQPTVWCNLSCDEGGRIHLNLPSEIAKEAKVIYVFENKITGKSLIGKTGGKICNRVSSYLSRLASSSKTKFLEDVRKAPDTFRFGILYSLTSGEDIDEYEKKFIEYKSKVIHLYNQRNGGGGGSARTEEVECEYYIPDPKTITPEKRYPFRVSPKGRIKPFYSPRAHKKMRAIKKASSQGFVYSIRQQSTGKRYIGASGTPLKRGREHGYAAEFFCQENEKKFDESKKSGALHPQMGRSPQDFSIGVLPIAYEKSQLKGRRYKVLETVHSLGEAEKLVIGARRTLFPLGFNLNKGGGGPIVRQSDQ